MRVLLASFDKRRIDTYIYHLLRAIQPTGFFTLLAVHPRREGIRSEIILDYTLCNMRRMTQSGFQRGVRLHSYIFSQHTLDQVVVEMLGTREVDCIILDTDLPFVGAAGYMRKIRTLQKHAVTPFGLIDGSASRELQDALRVESCPVFKDPLELVKFVACISRGEAYV